MKLIKIFKNYPATISYILFVVLLNSIFSYVPTIYVFHLPFSIGDAVVGGIYVLRDFSQREVKHGVILAMLIGCFFSYLLAEKSAAIASLGAFAAGELIDWGIFTFTKKPISQRVILSSTVSAPVDSFVNLLLLNQLNIIGFLLMLITKWLGILFLVYFWRIRQQKLTRSPIKPIF